MSDARFPTLAFSTLACPEWDAATVVARAAAAGYDGIEWRGGPDGTVRTDWPADARADLRGRLGDAGVRSIAVTAYTTFIASDRVAVLGSVDAAIAHAELAADLGAPTIRIFLGVADDDADEATLIGRAVDGLGLLLDRLRQTEVGVAIEPHDDHVRASSIAPILERIADPRLGIVWDLGNAWSAGEPPSDGFAVYEGRIHYVQMKDGTGRDATWRLCGLGDGDVPIADGLERLARSLAVRGQEWPPVSLEWERAWHPELAAADAVLRPSREWLVAHVAAAIEAAGRPTER